MNKNQLSIPLLLLVACLLIGCGRGGGQSAEEKKPEQAPVTVELANVETKPIDTVVAAQGTLAAAQGATARVAPIAPGRLLEVRVREGDHVTAGQVVAVLDNRPQQAAARSAAAALTTSQTQAGQSDLAVRALTTDQANAVRLARLTLDSARLDRDNAITLAQTALQSAQTDLTKTKVGARPQELIQADQAVNQARATRDRAETERERVQFLFDRGVSPKRQLDDANTALTVANSALESATQQASLVHAGARAEDVRAAELRVQLAAQSLDQAKTSGAAKVAQAEAGLRQAEQSALQIAVKRQEAQAMRQTVGQKRADLAAAEATANTAELRAPLSGTVTRRALNPGDLADTTVPVLEITETHALNLLANLPAEDGAKVRAGMSVRVASADMPGQTFSGSVLSIGQVDPQTNLLGVRIAVTNPQARLKAGAFATAEIVLNSNPRALVVPKQAVIAHEDKSVVFTVSDDNVAHQKEVEVGPEQGGSVEIVKGVKAGERVIRLGQYELADGAKIQTAAKEEKDAKGKDAAGEKGGKDEKAGAAGKEEKP